MKGRPLNYASPDQYPGAFRIAGIYLTLGILWILFSDRWAAAIAPDPETLTRISIIKGWGYMMVTALLLYGLARYEMAVLQSRDEALRQSEEKYRKLFAEMMNGCALHEIVYDADGKAVDYITLEVNNAYETMLNVKSEQVVGQKASQILPEEELNHWLGIFGPVAEDGKSVHYEMYSPFNQKYFEGSAYCPERGKFAVTFMEVTERKGAEQALHESAENLAMAQRIGHFGSWEMRLDEHQEIIEPHFWSDECYRIYGYEPGAVEITEEFVMSCIHPDDLAAAKQVIIKATHDHQEFIEEYRILQLDGTLRFIYEQGKVILDEQTDRPVKIVGSLYDITERRQAEKALVESEERFRSLYENSTVGLYRTTPDGRILLANPALLQILGYASFEELSARDLSKEGFEPSYQRAQFIQTMEKESEVRGLESIWTRADGAEIYVRESARAIRDAQGRILYFDGIFEDITQQKWAEEALRESEERYRTLAEAAEDTIFIINSDDTLQYINPSGARLIGRQPENIVGRRRTDIFPPSIAGPQKPHLDKVFQYGVPSISESSIPTPYGEAWLSTSLVPLKGNDGRVSAVLGISRNITERKWAEETVREKERQMHALVASLDDIVFEIDEQGTYLNIWSSSEELLVQPRDAMIGRTVVEMLGEETGRPFLDIYKRVLTTGQTENIEHIIDVAGGPHWFQSHISPIRSPDGSYKTVSVFVRDITPRKQAEDSLRKRTEELALLQEAGRELSSTLDLKEIYTTLYRYIAWSVPCDALVVSSFSSEENLIRRQYLRDREGEQDVSNYPPITLEPEGQGAQSQVIHSGKSLLLPDYETRRSAILVPLSVEGQVAGVLQVFSNALNAHTADHLRFVEALVFRVTAAMSNAVLFQRVQSELVERRRAEDEIRKLNAELEQRVADRTTELSRANVELERASRAKDEFLASMSHELRTPLNTILTLGESLEEGTYGPLSDRQIKPLHTATESGYHLLNLINDILDLSKIEAGKLELKIAPVEVEPLCQASTRLVMQQVQKKHLQFKLDVDPGLVSLNADARALKQMLVNLLSNAVKFTPEGGEIGLEVRSDAQRGAAHFTVWDTGIGIAPEPAQRLFRPFVQIDSGLARQYGGTGLGLSLVYRMAEMHGGGVSLESVPGKGSRFTISLPWSNKSQTADTLKSVHVADETVRTPRANNGHRPVLLIAEDNINNQTNYNDYLSARDYQVIVAANGIEAINRAREARPDLILMDIQMPGMDGLEVTRLLRADPELSPTPIIALTALAMPGDRERCLAAGANEYLAKPVSLKQLTRTIEEVLGKG